MFDLIYPAFSSRHSAVPADLFKQADEQREERSGKPTS
jgi:hypothetical protein